MQKLLIIHRKQFGYHTDSYKIALNLKSDFDVSFLCFESGLEKVDSEGVDVKYIEAKGSILKRFFIFYQSALKELRNGRYEYCFMTYFKFCCLLSVFSRTNIVLDYRTGSVRENTLRRIIDDGLARFESLFFRKVTVISEGLRNFLHIQKNKVFILPLGADVLSCVNKEFDYPKLLYIGTFNNRHLETTLEGVALYLQKHPHKKLEYHIVGTGFREEEATLKSTAQNLGLLNIVIFYGQKKHTEVQELFDRCNLGVSFVPITCYFDHQPPTKTFEYAMSGMAVLATATSEHKKIITKENGVLHQDTAESFCRGLEECVETFSEFSSSNIQKTVEGYSWSAISASLKRYLLNGS